MKNVSMWYQKKPIPQLSIFIQSINNYVQINTYWRYIVRIMPSNILLLASIFFFLTSQAVSLITDKKRQERKYTNKKGNIPTRKKNIPTRRGIYRQERKIYQQEEKITIRTIIIDISINKYIFIY
jgi:hypothetical protein